MKIIAHDIWYTTNTIYYYDSPDHYRIFHAYFTTHNYHQKYPLGLGRKIRAKLWPTPPRNSHFVAVCTIVIVCYLEVDLGSEIIFCAAAAKLGYLDVTR